MIQDKIFFDEKDPTGLSYNTPFTFYGSYQGRLYSKTPTGSIKYYTQNSDLSAYATTGSNQFSGSQTITGSLTVTGTITGTVAGTTSTASYVEYTNVANKPALVSGSSQVTYSGLTGVPSGIVSGSAQVTYSGLTGVPSGIVSGSAQISDFGIFATTGSNGFNGSQSITGSLTVTGQVVAQTLNVQQVTSSIVYSSGSNIFGNSLGNTQQFTGSMLVTGSLTSNGALTGTNATFTGTALLGGATATNPLSIRTANGESYIRFLNADGSSYGDLERSITGAGAVRFTGANFRFTAGAEVVGALTGSIATFSSSVTAGGLVTVNAAGNAVNIIGVVGNPAYYSVDQAVNNSGKRWRFGHTGGVLSFSSWDVYNETDNILALTIASTGAATFSSTIAASGRISTSHSTSGDYAAVFYNTSATGEGVTIRGGSTGSHNAFIVQPYNGATTLFSILATGAATFSGKIISTVGNDLISFENASITTGYNALVRGVSTGGNFQLGLENSVGGSRFTGSTAYATYLSTYTATDLQFATDNVLRLTIASTGFATFSNFNGAAGYGVTINSNSNTGTQYMISFDRIGVQAGYIASTSSTTAGIFNSSDYRLKEDLQSFSGIGKLMSMKFYDFKWKSEEGFRDYGVIAHELQEVLPMAVIGEKDGEVNQGVDYSKLIPIMAKAIQEQQEQIDSLKNQIK